MYDIETKSTKQISPVTEGSTISTPVKSVVLFSLWPLGLLDGSDCDIDGDKMVVVVILTLLLIPSPSRFKPMKNNQVILYICSFLINSNQLYLFVVLLHYVKNACVLYGTKYDINHVGGVVWYHRGSSRSVQVLQVLVSFPNPFKAHPNQVYKILDVLMWSGPLGNKRSRKALQWPLVQKLVWPLVVKTSANACFWCPVGISSDITRKTCSKI